MFSFQDSDLGPIYNVEETENSYKVTIGYTVEMIDEMARRVNKELDDEIMKRLGLVRPIRCRDCEHYYEVDEYHPQGNYEMRCCKYFDTFNDEVEPDGFCAWAVRRDA